MENQTAKTLIDKCLKGEASATEQALLETWYNQLAAQQKNTPEINYKLRYQQLLSTLPKAPENTKKTLKIRSAFQPILLRRTIAIAAAITAIIFGIWFYNHSSKIPKPVQNELSYKKHIAPGKNKAQLSLADGRIINLNEEKTGVVINARSLKYNDGSPLKAEQTGTGKDQDAMKQLIASTPRGGTYQITLSDGTKIWLNAATSLRFPSSFSGAKQRLVTLEGEAYFEIAKNKQQPFIVKSKTQQVEVLGTHFNINSYVDEENIKTTLLEGSVKVSTSANAVTYLKPGQQSILINNTITVSKANLEKEMAWKAGYFRFDDTDIKTIMRTVSRWYDIDVVYQGNIPATQFFGSISKYKSLDQILNMLELTGKVHFKLEERRIVVTP